MAQKDPQWPTITPNGPKMTPGFTHFFQELCEPISLSLERALSSEIGSQEPCSAHHAVVAWQHFMLLWFVLLLIILLLLQLRARFYPEEEGEGFVVAVVVGANQWLANIHERPFAS